jgi:hypothetical protein
MKINLAPYVEHDGDPVLELKLLGISLEELHKAHAGTQSSQTNLEEQKNIRIEL